MMQTFTTTLITLLVGKSDSGMEEFNNLTSVEMLAMKSRRVVFEEQEKYSHQNKGTQTNGPSFSSACLAQKQLQSRNIALTYSAHPTTLEATMKARQMAISDRLDVVSILQEEEDVDKQRCRGRQTEMRRNYAMLFRMMTPFMIVLLIAWTIDFFYDDHHHHQLESSNDEHHSTLWNTIMMKKIMWNNKELG